MNLPLQLRLRSIDVLVSTYGRINRSVLMDLHGVSVVQASLDLKEYMTAFPENLVYDKSTKAYVRSHTYIRSIP